MADVPDGAVVAVEERVEGERAMEGDHRLAVLGRGCGMECRGGGGEGAAGGDARDPGDDGDLDGATPPSGQCDPTYVLIADTTMRIPIITAVARRRVRSRPRRRR
jgi:hypothetical protein